MDDKVFEQLDVEDGRVAAAVKGAGCQRCGGRLDRADYPRKPRGGALGAAGEQICRRRSWCCDREGCRRRSTPPSLVFLGRRVYLGIVVLVETLRLAAAATEPAAAVTVEPAAPPRRTVRRWQGWFAALRRSDWWTGIAGRVWPPVQPAEELPEALVDRLGGDVRALVAMLRMLSPLTTSSVTR